MYSRHRGKGLVMASFHPPLPGSCPDTAQHVRAILPRHARPARLPLVPRARQVGQAFTRGAGGTVDTHGAGASVAA